MLPRKIRMDEVTEALRRALRRVARRRNLSREQIADLANDLCAEASVDPAKMRHWLHDQTHLFTNPLATVAALARLGELEPLEQLAEASGYQLRPIIEPSAGKDSTDVAAAAAGALGTESALVTRFIDVFSDGRVTADELSDLITLCRRDREANELLIALAENNHVNGDTR